MVANKYWNDPINDLPSGKCEPYMLLRNDIVLYGGHKWIVEDNDRFYHNPKRYFNPTIAYYKLIRYEDGLNKTILYITNENAINVVKIGEVNTASWSNTKVEHSDSYKRLQGWK